MKHEEEGEVIDADTDKKERSIRIRIETFKGFATFGELPENKKGRSIRIRIETKFLYHLKCRPLYKKGRSIRIRIETNLQYLNLEYHEL